MQNIYKDVVFPTFDEWKEIYLKENVEFANVGISLDKLFYDMYIHELNTFVNSHPYVNSRGIISYYMQTKKAIVKGLMITGGILIFISLFVMGVFKPIAKISVYNKEGFDISLRQQIKEGLNDTDPIEKIIGGAK